MILNYYSVLSSAPYILAFTFPLGIYLSHFSFPDTSLLHYAEQYKLLLKRLFIIRAEQEDIHEYECFYLMYQLSGFVVGFSTIRLDTLLKIFDSSLFTLSKKP